MAILKQDRFQHGMIVKMGDGEEVCDRTQVRIRKAESVAPEPI